MHRYQIQCNNLAKNWLKTLNSSQTLKMTNRINLISVIVMDYQHLFTCWKGKEDRKFRLYAFIFLFTYKAVQNVIGYDFFAFITATKLKQIYFPQLKPHN